MGNGYGVVRLGKSLLFKGPNIFARRLAGSLDQRISDMHHQSILRNSIFRSSVAHAFRHWAAFSGHKSKAWPAIIQTLHSSVEFFLMAHFP